MLSLFRYMQTIENFSVVDTLLVFIKIVTLSDLNNPDVASIENKLITTYA